MNVYELVEKVGGEIVRGKARVRTDAGYVVLGTVNGDHMMFTQEGTEMAREVEGGGKKSSRKSKTIVEMPEEIVEIEDAPMVEATPVAEAAPEEQELADLLASVEDK